MVGTLFRKVEPGAGVAALAKHDAYLGTSVNVAKSLAARRKFGYDGYLEASVHQEVMVNHVVFAAINLVGCLSRWL